MPWAGIMSRVAVTQLSPCDLPSSAMRCWGQGLHLTFLCLPPNPNIPVLPPVTKVLLSALRCSWGKPRFLHTHTSKALQDLVPAILPSFISHAVLWTRWLAPDSKPLHGWSSVWNTLSPPCLLPHALVTELTSFHSLLRYGISEAKPLSSSYKVLQGH